MNPTDMVNQLIKKQASAVLLIALSLLAWGCAERHTAFAQKKRPKLIVPDRTGFAGRLLLIPHDGRPSAWKLPRALARVVDYDTLYPSRELLGTPTQPPDAEKIIAWARTLDYKRITGVVVALDTLLTGAAPEQFAQRLEVLTWMRAQNPALLIYGFAGQTNDAISQIVFDDLHIEAQAPELAHEMVSRLLNRFYQRPPQIVVIAPAGSAPALTQTITRKVQFIGGQLATTRKGDIFLFIRTPDVVDAKLDDFVESLAKPIAAGYYVALADISGQAGPLLRKLRERKLLDLLQAYAASGTAETALGNALAHVSVRLIAAKILRNSLDTAQLQRIERSHVELLLLRYLQDWGYAEMVRPGLERWVRENLQADPLQLGVHRDAVTAFAQTELQLLAAPLFAEQFRHNIHTVRTQGEQRVSFQVEFLQRYKIQFPWQTIAEPELEIGVHLPLLVGSATPGIR